MKITKRQLRKIIKEAIEGEGREQAYEAMLSSAKEKALRRGSDWARDTLRDARNYPNMWQGQYDDAEEYVEQYGESASADMAMSIEYMLDDKHREIYRSLPDERRSAYFGRAFLPTKQTFQDIIADYIYDGVQQGIASYAST